MHALPGWAKERGEQKLREETRKYREMSPAQRFSDFVELLALTTVQLEASPFKEQALRLREPLPPFVAKLFAQGAKNRANQR